MKPLGIRRRLLLAVVAAVALAVTALLFGFNLLLGSTLDTSSRDLLRSRAATEASFLHAPEGTLKVFDAPDSSVTSEGNAWVFSKGRVLEHPHAGRRVTAAARSLAGSGRQFLDVADTDTRLYAAPVLIGGKRLGTVVVAASLAPYEETRRVALISSLVFGGLILLLVALAARWLLASSLQPVRRMTRQAATWSERDLDQRFALGQPHDELTELAATLDGLLDRLAASLRHEQRFSAELSHELRTPIARVLAESELALRRERPGEEYRAALAIVHRNAAQLARIVDALVAAARHEAGGSRGTADAYSVAAEASEACAALRVEHDVELQIDEPARPVRVGIDADLAERILQPVLENALRYGTSRVHVSIERRDSTVRYVVADDGPGVDPGERDSIFEPGVRGRLGAVGGPDGAGLGLALARRLARSVTGEVEALADSAGGRFLIRLPAA